MRPLPPYDGSVYGPLPAEDTDTQSLLRRYSCSKPTFLKRRDALTEQGWVNSTKVGTRVFYKPEEVLLLDQVAWWLKDGYSLGEVVTHLERTVKGYYEREFEPLHPTIEVTAETTTTDLVVKGLKTGASDLKLLGEELVERLAKRVGEEVVEALPKDYLATYDFLRKASDNEYLLTGKVLSQGLKYSVATVGRWGATKVVFGFLCVRVGKVGKGLWKVKRLSADELEAQELEAQQAAAAA